MSLKLNQKTIIGNADIGSATIEGATIESATIESAAIDSLVPSGDFRGGDVVAGTGVSASSSARSVQKVTLTLSGVEIDVAAADDFGSAAIAALPDSNLILLATEADLTLTKDGVVILAANELAVGLGTVATASADLSNAGEDDILTAVALTGGTVEEAFAIHSQADASLSYPIQVSDAAAKSIYLNVGCEDIAAAGTITAAGTVTLYYVDVGNVTS